MSRRYRDWCAHLARVMVFPGILALSVASVAAQETPAPVGGDDGPETVIYLVRHAERAADHPSDPTLTPEGEARALELARVLADVPLTRIFSTDLRRTRLTAAPVAKARDLEVESYDPAAGGLAELAERLAAAPGHHLVVGHSNTTPALVEALGGDPVSPIQEMEYDRLYIVVVSPGGTVTSTLLRFGNPGDQEVGRPGH